jgi:two-component system NtrC family sensor kinase
MIEKPESDKQREGIPGKVFEEGKDDLLERSLKDLENIVESHYKNLNLIQNEPGGKDKSFETQRELMKDLYELISDIKVQMQRKNEEFREAYAELQELRDIINTKEPKERYLDRELIQADKMVAVGQLAGGVAHELNNPLTGVLGNAQVLLTEIPKHNPWYEDVERIYESAKRCKEIVTNLLTFSRQQEFKFELVDINEVIQNTLNLCERELVVENIKVVKEFTNDLPKINVSILQMEQVFLNLIVNARQAMAEAGTLTISTRLVNTGDGSQVEVVFADTGKGIKKEDLPKMFKPFFTTKKSGKGTGLGLSVSRSIVEKHKGTIKVESEGEGKGAKFTVILR